MVIGCSFRILIAEAIDMREGNGDARVPRLVECSGHWPSSEPFLWEGRLLRVYDLSYTRSTNRQERQPEYAVRLWAGFRIDRRVFLAKHRSRDGSVDALHHALRAICTATAFTIPREVHIPADGFDIKLEHPELGTHSSTFVRMRTLVDGVPHDVAAAYNDFDTAIFLALCEIYDRYLCQQWERQSLRFARMTAEEAVMLATRIPNTGPE